MKKSLFRTLLAFSACCLSACAVDLGVFEKSDGYESYYDSFGDMKCLYDGGDHTYDIKDSLFNNTTVNSMSWDDDDDRVREEEYVYLILPFKTELKIESLALYFYGEENATMEVSFFYFENEDAAPKSIRYLTSPAPEPVYDEDGNPTGEEDPSYDDPAVETAVLTATVSLTSKNWSSIVFGNFQQEGYEDAYLHTADDGLLYLRVENNSGWNVDRLDPVSYSFINLLIRAV